MSTCAVAAVFVDDVFVGHVGEFNRVGKALLVAPGKRKIKITVGEFNGVGKALLVAPGKRKIKISLAGYQTFETEVTPSPRATHRDGPAALSY